MEYQDYIKTERILYEHILSYIDNKSNENDDFQKLIDYFEFQKIYSNQEDLTMLIHLLIQISNNHNRKNDFFKKVMQIFQVIIKNSTKAIDNFDLFQLCKSNKSILLFLIEQKIIVIDEKIAKFISNFNSKSYSKDYCHFFYPEIKKFLDKKKNELIEKEIIAKDPNIFTDFDKKRQKGENDSNICTLIQEDSIDEFISFANQSNLSFLSKIEQSIFETNTFLLKESPTIIEYAAFFGSIKIFQYLLSNNVELTNSLWLYAIHGGNIELIHLLEKNNVNPPNNSYEQCFTEAIKCHHNDIANYIKESYLKTDETSEAIYKSIFQYHNYKYFPVEFKYDRTIFYYLCRYNYFKLVELYLKPKKELMQNQPISIDYFNDISLQIYLMISFDYLFLIILNFKKQLKVIISKVFTFY